MNEKLKQTIKKLKEKNLEFKLVDLNGPAVSVEDVVARANISVKIEEICKTILMKGEEVFGVFLLGLDRIDLKKLKQVIGNNVRFLNKQEIKDGFGFELGEVCPLFLKIPIIVDKKVLKVEKVHFGSGDILKGLEMKSRDILKCINYEIQDVVA